MSRYLLIPNLKKSDDNNLKLALLLPTEFNGQIKEIEVPKGILTNFLNDKNPINRKSVQNILMKMDKVNIGRSKGGQLRCGSKILDINFDEFVHDSCSGKFLNCYESAYCILREKGITF